MRRAVLEQEPQREAVAGVFLRGHDGPLDALGERLAEDVALFPFRHRPDGVAVDFALQERPLEEVRQDRVVLVARPCGAVAPQRVQELLQALGAYRGLEVSQLEVGEVTSELVQAGLVVAIGRGRQPSPLPAQIVASLSPEWIGAIGLVLHGLAHYPRRQCERQAVLGVKARKLRHFAAPSPFPFPFTERSASWAITSRRSS